MRTLIFCIIILLCLPPIAYSVHEYVTLRDYVDIKMSASEKAVKIASDNLQRELEKLNELRQDVVKDRSLFVRQDAYEVKIKSIDLSIQEVKEKQISLETKFVTWISAISVFFIIIQIMLNYFNRKKVEDKTNPLRT